MRSILRHGALTLALLGSVGMAVAQEKAGEVGQNPAAQTPSGAIPSSNAAQNTQKGQAANAVPPEATGSAKDGGPAASNQGGATEAGGPPGATAQTMPSTRSAENAAEDKRIIVEHALELGDEQKQKIAQLMAAQMSASTTGSGSSESLAVGNTVPASVTMHAFPQSVNEQISEMQKYKYVQVADKILVIEPNNRIVVGVISR